jgi:RNA processing factor Prp31
MPSGELLSNKLWCLQILSDEEVETQLKEAAVISMGTEVSDLDLLNIRELCDQVFALSEYRAQLYDYLKSRMNTIAPNLTALVGELVGARLIAHGGSLLNLAKQPGSTIQILGAEKVNTIVLLMILRMDISFFVLFLGLILFFYMSVHTQEISKMHQGLPSFLLLIS